MLLGHIYLNALGKILHPQLANQLIGDIACHGIYTAHLRSRQTCDHGHHLVRNLYLSYHTLV